MREPKSKTLSKILFITLTLDTADCKMKSAENAYMRIYIEDVLSNF